MYLNLPPATQKDGNGENGMIHASQTAEIIRKKNIQTMNVYSKADHITRRQG